MTDTANSPAPAAAPVFSKGRDLDATAAVLRPWLAERFEVRDLTLVDFTYPLGAGVSNETILFEARWDGGGAELVLRAAPAPDYQMFLEPRFRMQYDLLAALYRSGAVRVPEVLWFEDDPAVLGQPFFVMRRMRGRVPVSMPVYNSTGWLTEATPAQRRTLWESAMGQFAAIHRVPLGDVGFVDWAEVGRTGVEQQLSYWNRFADWVAGDEMSDDVAAVREWLWANTPDEPFGLSWGDARMGNMMFGDDFEVVGVMDWEQASLAGSIARADSTPPVRRWSTARSWRH
jgi:aminoglycoside phosphotransferase (APT) family kinase protein